MPSDVKNIHARSHPDNPIIDLLSAAIKLSQYERDGFLPASLPPGGILHRLRREHLVELLHGFEGHEAIAEVLHGLEIEGLGLREALDHWRDPPR
jgi:hypothetical protein